MMRIILQEALENIRFNQAHSGKTMVAWKGTVRNIREAEAAVCRECLGTGTVSRWNEVAYFEDRRVCALCEAGRSLESKITDIVKRARLEERLARR